MQRKTSGQLDAMSDAQLLRRARGALAQAQARLDGTATRDAVQESLRQLDECLSRLWDRGTQLKLLYGVDSK